MAYFQGRITRDWMLPLTFLLLAVSIATATSPVPCEITKVDETGQEVQCSNVATVDTIISALEQLNAQPVYLFVSFSPDAVPTAEQIQNPVFANIVRLEVWNSEITDYTSEIDALLPKLRVLSFPYNNLTVIDETTFSGLNLTTLVVSHNRISEVTESAFRSPTLANLKKLFIDNNRITSLPATVFQGLHDLEILYLGKNDLTVIDENLFAGLSSLDILTLSYNKLSSFGLKTFENVPNLRRLYASGNQLQSIDTKLFESNTKLAHLDLSSNKLSNLAQVFLNIPSLKEIYLRNNNIERLTPDTFLLTPNLVVVNLMDNKLKGTSTKVFETVRQLRLVNLGGNKIRQLTIDAFRKDGEREGDSERYTVVVSKEPVDCALPEIVDLRNWFEEGNFSFYGHVTCENEEDHVLVIENSLLKLLLD